ncbi:hypothetical protein [Mycobacterium paraffinicum]|uniref:hypothetical protein n=1 Tax=Mycobacterium paraffinicum TaxID=53378 RepID=UPI001114C3E0|nr:hypothetical protein [Mycobacterium paraffinicum]
MKCTSRGPRVISLGEVTPLTPQHWNTLFEARVVSGNFKAEHNHRHRDSCPGYRTPADCAAACRGTPIPMACSIN